MAQAHQDFIFTQTDLSFNHVLKFLNELHQQKRLTLQNFQTVSLNRIESNNCNDQNKFGGQKTSAAAFGRTATAVIRMCMLKAVQINSRQWPKLGRYAQERNNAKLVFTNVYPGGTNGHFVLTEDLAEAKYYWSKYDQLFPHFLIETKVSESEGALVSLSGMMLIFRNGFSQVVEITTNVTVTQLLEENGNPTGGFESFVHVLCMVRNVRNEEGDKDGKFARQLKEMIAEASNTVTAQEGHIQKISRKLKDLKLVSAHPEIDLKEVDAYFADLPSSDSD